MPDTLPFVELDELAGRIADGSSLAIAKDEAGVAMAATAALIRRGARNLHLLCVPVSGIQADLLIGAGCIKDIECSAVTLAEFGMAPRFRQAVQEGKLAVRDATCPAIYAALQAAEKGNPFAPIRGLIGSDVLAHREDWKITDNPFTVDHDPIVVVPALRPDVALYHARLGDAAGNVWVGNRRELVIMSHAAQTSLVTVEEIYDGDLIRDEKLVAGTIPALYVEAVAHAPNGAWPLSLTGCYGEDGDHLRHYAEAARTDDGFATYLEQHVLGVGED